MKYKDKELTEYKTTEPVLFNPPKKMLVWYDNSTNCFEADVAAVLPNRESFPVVGVKGSWTHCSEIPEEPKRKFATACELAKWLAKGNGQLKIGNRVYTHADYEDENANFACIAGGILFVRKWGDSEWHEPTLEYMEIKEVK